MSFRLPQQQLGSLKWNFESAERGPVYVCTCAFMCVCACVCVVCVVCVCAYVCGAWCGMRIGEDDHVFWHRKLTCNISVCVYVSIPIQVHAQLD